MSEIVQGFAGEMQESPLMEPSRSQALKSCFQILDKDQSGYIDFGELRAFASRMRGPKANFEEAERMMELMDADGDHKITLQEYLSVMEVTVADMDEDAFRDVVDHVVHGLGGTLFAEDKGQLYLHPKGTRFYAQERVMPTLRQGLVDLLVHVEGYRSELLLGKHWDKGFLPHDWQPLSALRWLAKYLRSNNPYAEQPLPLGGLDVDELKARPWEQLNRKDKLTLAFLHLDRDHSGWLDADELLAVAGKLARQEDVEAARQLLADMDVDGNERVDLQEYISTLTKFTEHLSDGDFDANIRKVLSSWNLSYCSSREEKFRLVFRQLDSDGSGKLNLAELAELARHLDPEASDERILATLDYLDADHSSEVTEEEFVAALMKLTEKLENDEKVDACLVMMVDEPADVPSGDESDPAYGILPHRFGSFVRGLPSHKTAQHMSIMELSQLAANPEAQLVLVDVRTSAERAVSSMPTSLPLEVQQTGPNSCSILDASQLEAVVKAIQAVCQSPDQDDAAFYSNEDTLPPAFLPTVVVYCNSGQKGGIVSQMLSAELGIGVYNLLGGSINWYNTGGMMLDPAAQSVDALHPGSIRMAGFITRHNEFNLAKLRTQPSRR